MMPTSKPSAIRCMVRRGLRSIRIIAFKAARGEGREGAERARCRKIQRIDERQAGLEGGGGDGGGDRRSTWDNVQRRSHRVDGGYTRARGALKAGNDGGKVLNPEYETGEDSGNRGLQTGRGGRRGLRRKNHSGKAGNRGERWERRGCKSSIRGDATRVQRIRIGVPNVDPQGP